MILIEGESWTTGSVIVAQYGNILRFLRPAFNGDGRLLGNCSRKIPNVLT